MRPGGPVAKLQPSPEGLGINPQDDLSAVGAAPDLGPFPSVSLGGAVHSWRELGNKSWVPHSSPVFGLEWDTPHSTTRRPPSCPNEKKRNDECCGIPLKPKPGLNGAPSLRCQWSKIRTSATATNPVWTALSVDRTQRTTFTPGLWPAVLLTHGDHQRVEFVQKR
jgi:hypothetical protein